METTHKAVIYGAVSSPWWLPPVHDLSAAAAEALPLVGLTVMVITTTYKFWKWLRG